MPDGLDWVLLVPRVHPDGRTASCHPLDSHLPELDYVDIVGVLVVELV